MEYFFLTAVAFRTVGPWVRGDLPDRECHRRRCETGLSVGVSFVCAARGIASPVRTSGRFSQANVPGTPADGPVS